MIPMRLDEIAAVVGGDVHGDPAVMVTGAAYVDNRAPVPAGLFVAIVGERVDGHEYASGAHAVLGSRPTAAPTVVVADAVVALGLLARHVVDRTPALVLALTGSQGKTGTKDYLASVLKHLAGADTVVATEGNGNNELGVPLTVLRAGSDTDYLVVEMGARGIGHIAYLCGIAPPRIAAALNVGTAHVGEFGGREQIALAKGEIVEVLPADGTAVLNADDPLVAAMAARTTARVVTFGSAGSVRWDAMELDELGRPSFTIADEDGAHPVRLLQTGAHQAQNATAAAAMAVAAGFPLADVAAALVGGHRGLPVADGGARALRRDARRQRRLQRQPRLGARRARGAGRDRTGARSPYGRRAGTDDGARQRARGRPPVRRRRCRAPRRRRRGGGR